jgi:FtsZ-interacting cell division protein ZipA
MSDLQISLLIFGVFVIAGVYGFNLWQERKYRRRTEQAFAREQKDVLLQPESARAEERAEHRVEPSLQAGATLPSPPVNSSLPSSLAIDAAIDYMVEINLPSPADGADLHAELERLVASWHKPLLAVGYDPESAGWRPAGEMGGASYRQLRFAVQMSNRAGCIDQNQLAAFRDTAARWSEQKQGSLIAGEIEEARARALELDRFCVDVDIAFGVNVIAAGGNAFSGARIRALAEASGLELGADGAFHARGDRGDTRFTLINHEAALFVADQLDSVLTGGVTFLLDVPRVDGAPRVFDTMIELARKFSTALNGVLVDDNRVALSDDAIAGIRQQLAGIVARLEAGQIAAGGSRALRLFS